MKALIIASIALVSVSAVAETRTLTLETFRDKMRGAWIGQSAGVAWGQPTEWKYADKIMPDDFVPTWTRDFHDRYTYGNDDLYVEMWFMKTLVDRGLDVTIREAGIDYANCEFDMWGANLQGRTNLRRGIAPPDSAHPRYTLCANDIDYQIEADFTGIIAPGCPQEAIRLGNLFGALVNFGDGVWAGQFIGALYAEAYFTKDVDKILDAGLRAIPEKSDYAQMVRDVRAWHAESPDDWTACWEKIRRKYSTPKVRGWHGRWDVRLNGACVVLGLVYGGGDFEKSMRLAMRCGWDSDCNPSSVGGVLGCALGEKAIPAKWRESLNGDKALSGGIYTFNRVFADSERLARQIVARYGGKVVGGDHRVPRCGEYFVIPDQVPVPDAYRPSWEAGEVAGARYTGEEMKRIVNPLTLPSLDEIPKGDPTKVVQWALDTLYPGWKTSEIGRDRNPGYEESPHFGLGRIGYGFICTHPPYPANEVRLTRTFESVPENAALVFEIGARAKAKPLKVAAFVNGDKAWEATLAVRTNGVDSGLREIRVDLGKYAGRKAVVELVHTGTVPHDDAVRWGGFRLVTPAVAQSWRVPIGFDEPLVSEKCEAVYGLGGAMAVRIGAGGKRVYAVPEGWKDLRRGTTSAWYREQGCGPWHNLTITWDGDVLRTYHDGKARQAGADHRTARKPAFDGTVDLATLIPPQDSGRGVEIGPVDISNSAWDAEKVALRWSAFFPTR